MNELTTRREKQYFIYLVFFVIIFTQKHSMRGYLWLAILFDLIYCGLFFLLFRNCVYCSKFFLIFFFFFLNSVCEEERTLQLSKAANYELKAFDVIF